MRVAAGVDAAAIVALAVVIDEDHDEADAKKAKEEKEEGGCSAGSNRVIYTAW